MNKKYDVDAIVQEVEIAVTDGNYRLATEEERLQVRIAALENIVRSYKTIIANTYNMNVPIRERRGD
jgi:hypothetical protein